MNAWLVGGLIVLGWVALIVGVLVFLAGATRDRRD